jgi:hypothetical protein
MIKFDNLSEEQQHIVMSAVLDKRIKVTRDSYGGIDSVDIANMLPPKPEAPKAFKLGDNVTAHIEATKQYKANIQDWQARYNQINEV